MAIRHIHVLDLELGTSAVANDAKEVEGDDKEGNANGNGHGNGDATNFGSPMATMRETTTMATTAVKTTTTMAVMTMATTETTVTKQQRRW